MRLSRPALLAAAALAAAPLARALLAQTTLEAAPAGALPAPRDFRHHEQITSDYDAASGDGSLELQPVLLTESPERRLKALVVFRGARPTTPPTYVVFHLLSPERIGSGSAPAVAFELAGHGRVAPAITQRAPGSLAGHGVEGIAFRLSARDFARLVRAEEATLVVGRTRQLLPDDAMEALRDLGSRMTPAGFDRGSAARVVARGVSKDEYDAADVDQPARVTLLASLPRIVTRDTSVGPRHVEVEYVVDTSGRVDLSTFKGRYPERDAAYLDVLRGVLQSRQYDPARKDGHPVRQRMREVVVIPVVRPSAP